MSHVVEAIELDELVPVLVDGATPLVSREIDLIGHVSVSLTAEVGTAEVTIDQLFSLKAGEIVTLLQRVDEPLLLRLNGKAFARGELVAVDDNFGIKITEIM